MGNIGLCFVNPAPQIEPGYVTSVAGKVEDMELHSLWVIDRIVYDNLEPLTLLAAAAAVTKKIRLGTSGLLAKTVATLHFLSAGRGALGIGFGRRQNDFSAAEGPFAGRRIRGERGGKM